MSPSPFDDTRDGIQHPNGLSSFFRQLQEESRLWEQEGLISSQQRDSLLARYAAEAPLPKNRELTPEENPSSTREFPLYIRVTLMLAVFLIGLAVFLLISFNWHYLSGAVKLSIVGVVLASAHVGGFLLRKTGWKNWADGVFFFAAIMYGVGIWQIGQVFHLPADFPMGLWLWAVGVFLLAIALGSTVLHLLSVSLLGAWIIAALTGSFNLEQMFFYGWVPFSAPTLPVFVALGVCAGILRKNHFVSSLYVLLFIFWWILQGIHCELGLHLTFHIITIGLICMAVSTGLRSRNIHDVVLGRLGILLVLVTLIFPSFLSFWGGLLYWNGGYHERTSNHLIASLFWAFLLPIMNYLILVALFRLENRKESFLGLLRKHRIPVILATTIFVLWIGSSLFSIYNASMGNASHYRRHDQLFTDPLALAGMLLVNALIVMLTVWLIQTGLKRERGDWFWSGVCFFLLWTIIRYIDLFSGFGGMLGAAGIFMFCGLFMLGIVYVWATRGRRKASPAPQEEPLYRTDSVFDHIESFCSKIRPAWLSERNILAGVVLVVLIQFGILGAMISNEMRPHLSGTTIHVTTVPVDPRDLFRGDYVILRYDFSNLQSIPNRGSLLNTSSEQTVYVTMHRQGDLWEPSSISRNRPKKGVFLRGVLKPYGNEIVYGIESYFVQEGTGKKIEDAMQTNRDKVVVELTIAPDGKAAIKTVRIRSTPEPTSPPEGDDSAT